MTSSRPFLRGFLLPWVVGGALAAGCAPTLHPVPNVIETDPQALLARAEAQVEQRRALAAEARVEGRVRGSRLSGRATLLVQREGRLRIDAWTVTDLWVATLLADSAEVLWRQRGEPCHEGPSCPRNLEMLIPPGWDLRSTSEALLGRPPVRSPEQPWDLTFDRRVGAWRLDARPGPEAPQRVWIDAEGRFRRFETRRPGARPLEWEVEPSKEGLQWVRIQSGDDWVRLRLRDVEWNPEFTPEDFQVECPGEVVPMPCTEDPQ
ncbi:MAG TPA: hypothetical protein PLQ97_00465 [Myxococcota bacterium]|nr:hypothetical protein [Myxococcota bacterium]HQK49647.1 hypothetical protein [Myxococcota bacterium]